MKINLPVDAGNVSFMDLDFMKKCGGDIPPETDLVEVIPLEPGVYSIYYKVDCWKGKLSEKFDMHVPSGKLIIGDACYMFHGAPHDSWGKLLSRTEFLAKKFKGFYPVDTGGDGTFKFNVSIKSVKEGK